MYFHCSLSHTQNHPMVLSGVLWRVLFLLSLVVAKAYVCPRCRIKPSVPTRATRPAALTLPCGVGRAGVGGSQHVRQAARWAQLQLPAWHKRHGATTRNACGPCQPAMSLAPRGWGGGGVCADSEPVTRGATIRTRLLLSPPQISFSHAGGQLFASPGKASPAFLTPFHPSYQPPPFPTGAGAAQRHVHGQRARRQQRHSHGVLPAVWAPHAAAR